MDAKRSRHGGSPPASKMKCWRAILSEMGVHSFLLKQKENSGSVNAIFRDLVYISSVQVYDCCVRRPTCSSLPTPEKTGNMADVDAATPPLPIACLFLLLLHEAATVQPSKDVGSSSSSSGDGSDSEHRGQQAMTTNADCHIHSPQQQQHERLQNNYACVIV